jgi:hypothetical protein
MPLKPRWQARLKEIRAELNKLPAPFLDRPAIERLFGLRARQANYLMQKMGGGYRIGRATVLDRLELLSRLDRLSGARESAAASSRQARVVEALDQLRHKARPRRIDLPPPPVAGRALPDGARVSARGELTLSFASPEQLLGLVLSLAQSAAGDFAAFAASLEFEPHSGVESVVELRAEAGQLRAQPPGAQSEES